MSSEEGMADGVGAVMDKDHTLTRDLAAVLFSIILLYGIAGNSLLLAVFCSSRDIFHSRAFVLIASQLIVCAFIAYIPIAVVTLPDTIQDGSTSDAHKTTWTYSILASTNSFAFYATLHFTFFLALSRFVAIILPKFNAVFMSIKLYLVIVLVWLSVCAMSFVEFYYCTKMFYGSDLHWVLNCTKQTPESGEKFLDFRYAWTLALPIAMFLIYIAIFINLRHKRSSPNTEQTHDNSRIYNHTVTCKKSSQGNGKYERAMIIQAALVCGMMEFEIVCFYFLPKIMIGMFGEGANIPVNIFTDCIVIFNNAVQPTVYFVYSKRARLIVKHMFHELYYKIRPGERPAIIHVQYIPTTGINRTAQGIGHGLKKNAILPVPVEKSPRIDPIKVKK